MVLVFLPNVVKLTLVFIFAKVCLPVLASTLPLSHSDTPPLAVIALLLSALAPFLPPLARFLPAPVVGGGVGCCSLSSFLYAVWQSRHITSPASLRRHIELDETAHREQIASLQLVVERQPATVLVLLASAILYFNISFCNTSVKLKYKFKVTVVLSQGLKLLTNISTKGADATVEFHCTQQD